MARKKSKLIGTGLTAIFALFTLFAIYSTVYAEEVKQCRLVSLQGGSAGISQESVRIEPAEMEVKKGTCVVWINWVRAPEVQISFEEGKKCADVTESSTGFKLNAENCFVTSWVAPGQTSSLRFMEKGTYNYTVIVDGDIKENGAIIVK